MAESKKYGKIRLILWGLLGTISLFSLIVYLICEQAASVKLPESLKKAPIEFPSSRPAAEASARPRPAVPDSNSSQLTDFNDYLKAQLVRDPGLESARLYLELVKRVQDENFYKPLDNLFPNTYPDRLSPEQVRWLHEHEDLIARLQRFSRGGPLPLITAEERQDALKQGVTSPLQVSYLFFQVCSRLLVVESQLLSQEGNHAGAREAIQDLFSLAGMLKQDDEIIGRLMLNAVAGEASRRLEEWIERRDFPIYEIAPLLAGLKGFEAVLVDTDALVRSTAFTYLGGRMWLVRSLEEPTWRSPLYGWDRAQNPRDYETELLLPKISVTVPNVPRILSKAWLAIRNREHAAEALQEYDRVYLKYIENMKLPYPQFVRDEETLMRDMDQDTPRHFLFRALAIPNYLEYRVRVLAGETRIHLNRVGLGLRVDQQQTRARRSESFAGDPRHPWRDPFTEKPLQYDETSSPTLVWSLGPDLKDQRGMINYDPSNGTVSAGDLVIRVPR